MRRGTMLLVALLVGALAIAGLAFGAKPAPKPKKPKKPGSPAAAHAFSWHDTPTGSTASLRGLSAVSRNVAWASGSAGTVLRTLDRGATWQSVGPPGTDTLQFRDIEAFGPNRAVIMAAGTGTDSRIYRTTDGGATWTLVFQNMDANAFYDCMTFFNRKIGLALSDPPDGMKFRILKTTDNGQCITSNHGRSAWFGTGASTQARVFTSRNRGRTWSVSATPMASGPTAGINALAFRSQQHGLAVGGDFAVPATSPNNFAATSDGGSSWALLTGAPAQYRSGATWVNGNTAIAVGLTGSDVTRNKGRTWTGFDEGSLHTVDCANPNACWASGASGRVAYLTR